ncbi:unnamed protein product, partial [Timema podura]|nr:unnamed protein product [Timema podura]
MEFFEKDTETSESTDTTNTSLNHPSTSQQENFVPCLIDVEDKDSNHSINFTPHRQLHLGLLFSLPHFGPNPGVPKLCVYTLGCRRSWSRASRL